MVIIVRDDVIIRHFDDFLIESQNMLLNNMMVIWGAHDAHVTSP